MRSHILSANRLNSNLQLSAPTPNREMKTIAQTTTEKNIEVTVKFLGLSAHPIPNSTQIIQRTFPSRFFLTSIQLTSSKNLLLIENGEV